MAVGPINGSQSDYRADSVPTATNPSLDQMDFYTLLAAQLKYQDADNPMDTSQMMASMVQTQMIQAIMEMTSMNMTSYASSMIGKQVTVAVMDNEGMYSGDKTGVVTGVVLGSNPIVFVDGVAYNINQVVSIGEIPKKDDDKNDGEEPKDPVEGSGGDDNTTENDETTKTESV